MGDADCFVCGGTEEIALGDGIGPGGVPFTTKAGKHPCPACHPEAWEGGTTAIVDRFMAKRKLNS